MTLQAVELFSTGSGPLSAFGAGTRRLIAKVGRKWVTLYDPHTGTAKRVALKAWRDLRAQERADHAVGWSVYCNALEKHAERRPLTRFEQGVMDWACRKMRENPTWRR